MQAVDIERNLLDVRNYVNEILEFVLENAESSQAHEMEQEIKTRVLTLGKQLLELYFDAKGTGYEGERLETEDGIYYREYKLYPCDYFSIFGKIKVQRTCYKQHGQKNIYPLNKAANLPDRSYSYPLQELMNLESLKHPYGDSTESIEKFLGIKLSVNSLEIISEDGSQSYDDFYEDRAVKPNELSIQAVGFDGKGVPIIREDDEKGGKAHLGKGEKKQKKKESLVGVCYECEPKFRNAEDIARNLVFGNEQKKSVEQSDAKAQNIRRMASLEKPKEEVVDTIACEPRSVGGDPFHQCIWVIVMDGAIGLWHLVEERFKGIDYVPILDIIHVSEYLWDAAHSFFPENSPELKSWVYEKLAAILQGKVGRVIGSLKQLKTKKKLRGNKCKQVEKAITYFENHRQWMKYDQYLEQGLPIASGVVESTCGHLVKDRMERSGCRWDIQGAEAILKLRSVKTSHNWDEYWKDHIELEADRLYDYKLTG